MKIDALSVTNILIFSRHEQLYGMKQDISVREGIVVTECFILAETVLSLPPQAPF